MQCIFFRTSAQEVQQYKITDTVYYNKFWLICEKPLASYYRAGLLATYNNAWYYVGEVKDYKIDNTLIMKGNYSEAGTKDGKFTFYYPDGVLMASGNYKNDTLVEKWTWYYPDGKEQAIVDFSSEINKFDIIKFVDEKGNTTLENGEGEFSFYSDPFEWEHTGYLINGSYKSGKRSGTWHFDAYPKSTKDDQEYKIKYRKNGEPVANEYDFGTSFLIYRRILYGMPARKFYVTERMSYDELFKINGDSTAMSALAYYLIDHKPTEVELRYKIFNVAFNTILNTLERYKYKLHFNQDKEINGKLEFKIGSKGFLENISFTASGLDMTELGFFTFLLGKFKHVEMPGDQAVAVETNYTIYVFSIDFKDVIPDNIHTTATKDVVFSFMPKEKVEKYLLDHKKELKKMNKEKMNSFYQDYGH